MRIVYFTDAYWPRVNGVTVSVQTFADALKRRGHEIRIVCPEYPEDREATGPTDELGVIRIPSVGSFFSKEDRFSNPLKLVDILPQLDAFNPDVVHVQTEFSFGTMGRHYCRTRGYPVVSTCHTHWEQYFEHYIPGMPSRFARAIARTIMRTAYRNDSLIVVPSQQIAKVLTAYGIKKEFPLIPTGIDADFFKPNAARDERVARALLERFPGLAIGPFLLFVGRVGQEKNVAFLFEVLKRVLAVRPDATLLLVGDGPYRSVLQKRSVDMGLKDSCLFTGYMPREELPSIYAMADIFVFPSKTETQGLVTIESMLCGTPVVAIGEMGTADVMAGDNGGFMVKDNLEDFTARVLQLLDDDALRAAKSAEALEYAQRWTVEGMTDKLEVLYRRAAAARLPKGRGPVAMLRHWLWKFRRAVS